MNGSAFQQQRGYRLDPSDHPRGVGCDDHGPSLGPFRLLRLTERGFEPRPLAELDFLLTRTFGTPLTSAVLRSRLSGISKSLNAGDLARAMISTQLLGLPVLDPEQSVRAAKAERLLKAGYNPDEPRDAHGRWTSDGNVSRPAGNKPTRTKPGRAGHRNPLLIPAQVLVEPMIGELPWIETLPIPAPLPLPTPMDIVPPTIGNPDLISPRTPTANPYPEKRKCVEEWADAYQFCNDLKRRGLLGKDGYRGFGKNLDQCIRGQVSEECGGNPTA